MTKVSNSSEIPSANPKEKYLVTNWSVYNKALVNRGDITITIAIDSTGVKVFGEGEWKVRQHGWSKRRSWRKLHLGVDPKTGFVHCHVLTQNNESDDAQLPQLLEQIKPPVEEACFDGAYDTEKCWDKLISQGTKPIIPPQKVECSLKIKALNQMTAIGMPIAKPRKATA
jgi:hypothetical protein